MREKEALYIIGLDSIDPLKAHKLEEQKEKIAENLRRRRSTLRSERRASRIIEMQQKWEQQRILHAKTGTDSVLGTVQEDNVHDIHACCSSSSPDDGKSKEGHARCQLG